MYYINLAQSRALGPRALSSIGTVFGHDLCNLCHQKNAVTLLFALVLCSSTREMRELLGRELPRRELQTRGTMRH